MDLSEEIGAASIVVNKKWLKKSLNLWSSQVWTSSWRL